MFRYLIYRTDFDNTIVRESETNNPGVDEASLFTDFVIPEIQPLYLWRVNGTDVEPNDDQTVRDWLEEIAPNPTPDDLVTYSQLTGSTAGKMDKVSTADTGNVPIFDVDGNVEDSGLTIAEITGLTTYDFIGSGGTNVDVVGNTVTISSAVPTGLTDTRLENIEEVTDIAITGSTNGLTTDGRNIKLGGELDENTVISGTTNSLTIDVNGINLRDNGGSDVNIESDGGSVLIKGNDGTSVTQTQIDVSETGIVVTDNRTTSTGVEYADDYSADFVARSLVDKAYVDAVASGLVPKANVQAVTTQSDGNIDLIGGTFGGTIDGITIVNEDRVLITEQTLGQENGIYIYNSGTNIFTRADDFDGTPDGEVVDGNIVPVLSGATYSNTIWILVTPNPITIDVTPLTFSFFSRPVEYTEGVGIDITANQISVDGAALAGNSISWTGNTFNVDINSGTLSTKINEIESNLSTVSGDTANKLDITDFDVYSGATDTRLTDIESDIITLSGDTENKLDTTDFNAYTGITESKIQLVSTGDTDINTIAVTEIVWDDVDVIDSTTYSWTGGTSSVEILETGQYELKYNITVKNSSGNSSRSVGSNIVLNNNSVVDITSNSAVVTGTDNSSSLSLSSVILTLNAGDIIDLVGFRIGNSGVVNAVGGSTFLYIRRIL